MSKFGGKSTTQILHVLGEIPNLGVTVIVCATLMLHLHELYPYALYCATDNRMVHAHSNNIQCVYIGFEALHGEVSMYIWLAVTPCVYLLAR